MTKYLTMADIFRGADNSDISQRIKDMLQVEDLLRTYSPDEIMHYVVVRRIGYSREQLIIMSEEVASSIRGELEHQVGIEELLGKIIGAEN